MLWNVHEYQLLWHDGGPLMCRDKKAALAHQRARSGFATLPVVPLDLEEEPLEVGPSLPVSVPRLVSPRTAPASRAVSRSV
jgi:hypothetical protein